jgi:type II secretory pathway component PulM
MIQAIKHYLEQLNERDRRAVIAAAVALGLFLPYQIIWAPFHNSIKRLDERVEQQHRDLVWMQEHVAEAQELARAGSKNTSGGQPVYSIVESSSRQQFGSDIRVQQEGKGGVRVIMKNVAFDKVLLWLDELYYRQHINVAEFTVEKDKESGRVSANILIES